MNAEALSVAAMCQEYRRRARLARHARRKLTAALAIGEDASGHREAVECQLRSRSAWLARVVGVASISAEDMAAKLALLPIVRRGLDDGDDNDADVRSLMSSCQKDAAALYGGG